MILGSQSQRIIKYQQLAPFHLTRIYIKLSKASIRLYGQSGSKGTMKLNALGILGIFELIDVELDNCPPGLCSC